MEGTIYNQVPTSPTLMDLRLYRAQWRRILATTLYFLEVQAGDERLYKIGVTQGSVDARVAEIAQDVRAVAGDATIQVLAGRSGGVLNSISSTATRGSSDGSGR